MGEKKYDASAAAMITLLKYGSGVPWDRLEASLGIPLPASTQCEIVAEVAEAHRPVFEELIRQAAQGEVFYNGETRMKILALSRASPPRLVRGPVRGKESGAQLGAGRGHHLLLETLDLADAVPPPSRGRRWTRTSWSAP